MKRYLFASITVCPVSYNSTSSDVIVSSIYRVLITLNNIQWRHPFHSILQKRMLICVRMRLPFIVWTANSFRTGLGRTFRERPATACEHVALIIDCVSCLTQSADLWWKFRIKMEWRERKRARGSSRIRDTHFCRFSFFIISLLASSFVFIIGLYSCHRRYRYRPL